ncbi:Fc.00g082490.m01.CDS01 [Cosmosporella sp. VM-42]
MFSFYGQIHMRPKINQFEVGLELVNGDFLLVLAQDVSEKDAPLHLMAILYGAFLIGDAEVDACASFQQDGMGVKRIQFELPALPNVLSVQDFLNNLPTSTKDCKAGSFAADEMEYVIFSVYGRRFDSFRVPFLDQVALRDLIFMIEFKS